MSKESKPRGNPNPSPLTRFGAINGNKQSPGGWKPENTISYQYKRLLNMSAEELKSAYKKENEAGTWTVAMELAYQRIRSAQRSLPDVKEITDRTEGKAAQAIDVTSNGETIQGATIGFTDKPAGDPTKN